MTRRVFVLLLLMILPVLAQTAELTDPVGQLLFVDGLPPDKVGPAWVQVAAERPEVAGSAFVTTASQGWTGLLVRAMETMPPEQASEAAQELSGSLQAGVLHLALSPDGRAWYFYWKDGKLVDRYCSNPGKPGEVAVEVVRSWQGRPELLLPVARGTPLSKNRNEVSLTDFNGFLYSYYPEMKISKPGAWRTANDVMLLLVQVMGLSHSPIPYLSLKSQPGWKRISPAAPGE